MRRPIDSLFARLALLVVGVLLLSHFAGYLMFRLERNQSQSRQTIENDLVDVEGEEEGQFQNAGGGQARQRANKQNVTARGRQDSSARGRESGPVRVENAGRTSRGNTQGITNRSSRQENQRQQKVAPMRAEGKNARGNNKRRAS